MIDIIFFIISIFVAIFGIYLICNGIKVYKYEGKTFSHFLPVIFGIFLIILSCLFDLIIFKICTHKIIILLIYFIGYLPVLSISLIIYSNIYNKKKKYNNPKYIIVLGCKIRKDGTVMPLLRGRLDVAINYYNKLETKPIFIVCGGKGSDEPISEAESMKNYLIFKGIDKKNILLEDKSVNTVENLRFAKEKYKIDDQKCIICTSKYHLIRTMEICKYLGINANGIGSSTSRYFYPSAICREVIAYSLKHYYLVILYIIISFILTVYI